MTATLEYPNSDQPAGPDVPAYPASTQHYTGTKLDYTKSDTQELDLSAYGMYFSGTAEEGYQLVLHGAYIDLSAYQTSALVLPPDTTVKLMGENIITGANSLASLNYASALTAAGALTVESVDSGSLSITNCQYGINAPSTENGVFGGKELTGDVRLTNADLSFDCSERGINVGGFTASGLPGRALVVTGGSLRFSGAAGYGMYLQTNHAPYTTFTGALLQFENMTNANAKMFQVSNPAMLKDCTLVGVQVPGGCSVGGKAGDLLTVDGGSVDISMAAGSKLPALSSTNGIRLCDVQATITGSGAAGSQGLQGNYGDIVISGGTTTVSKVAAAFALGSGGHGTVTLGGTVLLREISAQAFPAVPLGQEGTKLVLTEDMSFAPDATVKKGAYSYADGAWQGLSLIYPEVPVPSGAGKVYPSALDLRSMPDNAALSEYGIYWDASAKRLVLHDATIAPEQGAAIPGLESKSALLVADDLTILLVGKNKIASSAEYGIYVSGDGHYDGLLIRDFNAAHTGTLSLSGSGTGIFSEGTSVSVQDAGLSVSAGSSGVQLQTDSYATFTMAGNAAFAVAAPVKALSARYVELYDSSVLTLMGAGAAEGPGFFSADETVRVELRRSISLFGTQQEPGVYRYDTSDEVWIRESGCVVDEKPDVTVKDGVADATVDETITVEQDTPVTITAKAENAQAGTVKKSQVTIPPAVVEQLDKAVNAVIETDVGGVTFDQDALAAIKDAAGGSALVLAMEKKEPDAVLEAQKPAVQNAKFLVDLSMTAGESAVAFSGGTAKVRVPYAGDDHTSLGVFYVDESGFKNWIASTYDAAAGVFEFETSHFSLYALEEAVTFTMNVTGENGRVPGAPPDDSVFHYIPGDTFTVEIWGVPSVDTTLGAFQVKLDYDHEKLHLDGIASEISGSAETNGDALAFTVNGEGAAMSTAGLKLATAAFTVQRGFATGQVSLGIVQEASELTQQGKNASPLAGVNALPVNLHNVKLTLTAGSHASFPEGASQLVAYAKYGVAGLYTDDSYQRTYTMPVLTADAGYRMAADTQAEPLWQGSPDSGDTLGYTTEALETLPYSSSMTLTAQVVKTHTISFSVPVNGSLSSGSPIVVDTGTCLKDAGLPGATPAEGYGFKGWSAGGAAVDAETYIVTGDVTLTAIFQADTHPVTLSAGEGTQIIVQSGILDGSATYGVPITFKVTAAAGYTLTGVSYSAGGGAAVTLQSDVDGVYTIPGEALLGAITVESTALHYYAVTFLGGTGTVMETAVAYVRAGQAGLFADKACKEEFLLPAPAPAGGYRLARDVSGEELWSNGPEKYTSAGLKDAVFTEDTALSAQAVKIWQITFQAGEHGALAGEASLTVDDGTTLTAGDVPAVAPDPGYVFDKWDTEPTSAPITGDATFTVTFRNESYAIHFPSVAGVTFTPTSGITDGKATHGTDISFAMAVTGGYKVTAVRYKVAQGEPVALSPVDNVYTIPGAEITGNISVTIESTETFVVTFAAGDNGTLDGDMSIVVDAGHALTAGEIPAPRPDSGYVFDRWDTEPLGQVITSDVTFTAGFKNGVYSVTAPEGVSLGAAGSQAHHGADFVFTPSAAGRVITGVSCQIGDSPAVRLTADSAGAYTIPGSAITGNIALTVEQFAGSISFLSKDVYKAVDDGRQVVLVVTDKLSGGRYQFTDGAALFYSGEYGAYAAIVSAGETAAGIAGRLTTAAGAAQEISYVGDLNGDGKATAADAGIINDVLHSKRTDYTSDLMRLMADVTGDRTVSTGDVTWTLRAAVGLGE